MAPIVTEVLQIDKTQFYHYNLRVRISKLRGKAVITAATKGLSFVQSVIVAGVIVGSILIAAGPRKKWVKTQDPHKKHRA